MHTLLNFGLAKEQLQPIGPSQALLNCCDAVVNQLHMYGDVCIVDDRVYYNLFASMHVVIIGDWHGAQPMSLSSACKGAFFKDILGCLTSAYLCGPCILVRQKDVSVLVYSSSVHLGLLTPFTPPDPLNAMSSKYDLQAHCNEIADTCLRVHLSTDTMFYTSLCRPTRLETPKGCETNLSIFINI